MRIGGFVKQSLIDYPGKIAAIVFTQGCNFRCGYCHNPALVLPGLFQNCPEHLPDNILNYLKERKGWLDGVVVTGGEPTIHNDLPQFLKEIKSLGYFVKLDTNGSNPSMLELIVDQKLVDYIAMDIKTIITPAGYSQIIGIPASNALINNINASIALIKQSRLQYEFRTTHIPGHHTPEMFKLIASCTDTRYTINPYRDGETVGKIDSALRSQGISKQSI
jgi:pyruvate formate lyase activating enzyme